MNILDKILTQKRLEVSRAMEALPLEDMRVRTLAILDQREFLGSLIGDSIAVIAELKKASPSRGLLVDDFRPSQLATEYAQAGARALSVLTDREFFQGAPENIRLAKNACRLPVLRKDFIINPYQVYESRLIGADAILLIVKALSVKELASLQELAWDIGLDVLVETHTMEEVQTAVACGAKIIGVNNRDLTTFQVDLERSFQLVEFIPSDVVAVSESGIKRVEDVERLKRAGFDAILVGEGLVAGNSSRVSLADFVGVR